MDDRLKMRGFNLDFDFEFNSAHPTGWAESIGFNGVCVCVYACVCAFTSKMINNTAQGIHRPL